MSLILQEVRFSNRTPPESINFTSRRGEQSFIYEEKAREPRVSSLVAGVPSSFIELYADTAVRHAVVEEIEPGHWFSEVKGIVGAWGDGPSAEEAKDELHRAVFCWVELKLESGNHVPVFPGLDLNLSRTREQTS